MNISANNFGCGRTLLAPGGSASRNEELRRLWQDAGWGEPACGPGGRAPSGREPFAATMR